MRFNLEVHLCIDETGMLSKGSFIARNKSEIPIVAYQFIQSNKSETGYRKTEIQQVIVNGTEDITEAVKKIENLPIPYMDDIFW